MYTNIATLIYFLYSIIIGISIGIGLVLMIPEIEKYFDS